MPEPMSVVCRIAPYIGAQKIISDPRYILNFKRIWVYVAVMTPKVQMNQFIFNKTAANIGPVMGGRLPGERTGETQFFRQTP